MVGQVAAALESVFPRIGLKSFIMLPPDQKKAQLEEMTNIVLGIRLFNREIGKGGAGLEYIEDDALQVPNRFTSPGPHGSRARALRLVSVAPLVRRRRS